MKKLKKELKKIFEGYKFVKIDEVDSWKLKDSPGKECIDIAFVVKKIPTKDELLEKAKKEYHEGTIFECLNKKCECLSTSEFQYYPYSDSIDSIHKDGRVNDIEGAVYLNGEWAKIIKKPILKIGDTFLYGGEIVYRLATHKNYELTTHELDEDWEPSDFDYNETHIKALYFLTKEDALEHVLQEAKYRFEGKKVEREGYLEDEYCDSLSLDKSYKGHTIVFTNKEMPYYACVWREDNGFIVNPVKEPKLMLGEHDVKIEPVHKSKIIFKNFEIKREDWLKWAKVFIPVVKFGGHVNLKLGEYEAFNTFNRGIFIGCVEGITVEQIEMVTKEIEQ